MTCCYAQNTLCTLVTPITSVNKCSALLQLPQESNAAMGYLDNLGTYIRYYGICPCSVQYALASYVRVF